MKRITTFLLCAFAAMALWLAVHLGLVDKHVAPVDPRLKAINAAVSSAPASTTAAAPVALSGRLHGCARARALRSRCWHPRWLMMD